MVESRIDQVTVYSRGAAVRRTGTTASTGTVRIAGLPLALIDDTVRVEVDGGPVATAVRTGTDAGAEVIAEESAELRAARRREAIATAEVVRLETALDKLAHAPVIADDETDDTPAAWSAVVAARRGLIESRAQRERALRDQLAAARRELDEAHRAHEVIATRDALKGSAQGPKLHEVRKYVELELTGAGPATLRLEYQVGAARWAPAYVARLDGEATKVELRAVVAQDSGEDWNGVALRLSTAEPSRFAPLPELAAQKIGRRQQEPVRKGFRPAPTGSDALYADYDRSFPRRTIPRPFKEQPFDDSTYEGRAPTAPEEAFAQQVWDEDSSHAKGIYKDEMKKRAPGAVGGAAPMAQAAPAPAMFRASAPRGEVSSTTLFGEAPADARIADKTLRPEPRPAEPQPRLDYGNLVMGAPSAGERGRLVPAPRGPAAAGAVAEAVARIGQMPLPAGHVAEWAHSYDYAFASDGAVDIASDGAWHAVALTTRPGTAKLRHVAVPREQADVFRVAEVENPFDGPLLPGPIDVYDRGQFLVTSSVDYTPPGGSVEVGLGVDAAIKIARNAEFHEEAAGMLRGALRLVHAISVEVENGSPRAIDLEVRERVPITRQGDDEIEVSMGRIDPAWEAWAPEPDAPGTPRLRGAYRWRISLAPAAKKLLRASYDVKIPSKTELIGGNRREP